MPDRPSFQTQAGLWPRKPRIAPAHLLVVRSDTALAIYLQDQDRVVVGLFRHEPVLEEREEDLVDAVAVQAAAVPVERAHPDPQGMTALPLGQRAPVPLRVDPVLDAQRSRYLVQLGSVLEAEDHIALFVIPLFVRRLRDKSSLFVFGGLPLVRDSASARELGRCLLLAAPVPRCGCTTGRLFIVFDCGRCRLLLGRLP
jgi:hypothetical protein